MSLFAVCTLDLSEQEVYTILRNGFEASFVSSAERQILIDKLDAYWGHCTPAPH